MVSKEEMGQIMKILRTAYPRYYANTNKEDMINAINLWCEMFSDIDILTLATAVKSLISHFEYPPTIADVKKEIVKYIVKDDPIDYWNEAYKMICNGIYMTQEEFDSHSEICRRYFGSVARLREKASTENLNMEVEQSLFNQTAKTIIKRDQENAMLPNDIKFKLQSLSDKLLLN